MSALDQLIGQSAAIASLRDQIRRVVQRQPGTHRPPAILLLGETGTGKGLVARTLHAAGHRAGGPFVDVNCAALPEALLEAELFGYERGAFTGARHGKPGLFQVANRGTIFLDEVSSLSSAHQAKLLKAVEDRTLRRVGSTRDEPVDAWIVAASSDDLLTRVRAGQFREDLYHRLAVVSIRLPALRQRGADVVLLAERFLARVCGEYGLRPMTLTDGARAALLRHSWPGNVRELANLVERVVLLSDGAEVTAEMLEFTPVAAPPPPAAPAAAPGVSGARARRDAAVPRSSASRPGVEIGRGA
jgi:DNA-binding NtrC family response regulator